MKGSPCAAGSAPHEQAFLVELYIGHNILKDLLESLEEFSFLSRVVTGIAKSAATDQEQPRCLGRLYVPLQVSGCFAARMKKYQGGQQGIFLLKFRWIV